MTFNDYNRVFCATEDPAANYNIELISLDMVTDPELARTIHNQYTVRLAILMTEISFTAN